jgi:pyrroline-5-carboxylate reductase
MTQANPPEIGGVGERPSVAIIGIGAMGKALATGMLAAGWAPSQLSLAIRRPEQLESLRAESGVTVSLDPREASSGREVIVIAVKPRDVPMLLEAVGGGISAKQIVLSIAAGIPTSTFEKALGKFPVVGAMPNTPALVGQGVTGVAAGQFARPADVAKTLVILKAVGSVREMDEGLLDAVTAVSGTGPAYVFLLAEALTEAAVREGLPRDVAESFVHQTIRGAGHLLTETGQGPSELRSQVTSPGGTTAAAMHVLEERGFRAVVEDAVRAAAQRARELGVG